MKKKVWGKKVLLPEGWSSNTLINIEIAERVWLNGESCATGASTKSPSGQPRSSLPRQATVPARSASTKSPSGQPRSSWPRQSTVAARLAGSLSLPTTAPTISLSTSLLRTICNNVLASSGPCLESSYYYYYY